MQIPSIDLRKPSSGIVMLCMPFLLAAAPLRIVFFILLIAVGAILVPGLRRLQAVVLWNNLHIAAVTVLLVYTLILALVAVFGIPAALKGAAGWNAEATSAIKVLATKYGDLLNFVYGKLDSLGVTADMIDAAVKSLRENLSLFAEPAKTAASWTAGLFISVPMDMLAAILFGYMALMMAWILADEHQVIRGFFEQFFPNQADDLADIAKAFRETGALLFWGMAKVMIVSSAIFVLVLAIVIGISWGASLFYGVVLGLTGGIPFFGGFINYGIVTIIGLNHFGFGWALGALYLLVTVVHQLEMNALSPYLIGSTVGMKYFAFTVCILMGTVVLGTGFLGLALGLLLLVYYKAVSSVVGVPRPAIASA